MQQKSEIEKLMRKVVSGKIKPHETKKFSKALEEIVASNANIDEKMTIVINKKKYENITALECAVICQNRSFILQLLAKKAKPAACKTPLLITTVKHGKYGDGAAEESIKIFSLLSHVTNTGFKDIINYKIIGDDTLFHCAIKVGIADLVQKCLQAGVDPNLAGNVKCPPIFLALSELGEHPTIVKLLCEANANLRPIFFQNKTGSPLGMALFNRHISSACYLLDYIVRDDDYPLQDLYDSVEYALKPGYEVFLEKLLQTGKIDIQLSFLSTGLGDIKRTPLQHACRYNNIKAMEIIVQHGANVHDTDMLGGNLLHIAITNGHFEATEFLLKKGVEFTPDIFGNDPIKFAIIQNQHHLIPLLKKYMSQRNLSTAIQHDNVEMVLAACQNGADIYFCEEDGSPLLHQIIEKNKIYLLKKLLKSGIIFEGDNADKAFAFAILHRKTDVVKLFLSYFDPLKTTECISPFFRALYLTVINEPDEERDRIVKLMIEYLKHKQPNHSKLNAHIQHCLELAPKVFENTDEVQKISGKLKDVLNYTRPKIEDQPPHWSPTLFPPNPDSGMSGRQFVKTIHHWTDEDIEKAQKERLDNLQSIDVPLSSPSSSPFFMRSWFDDSLCDTHTAVKPINDPNNLNRQAFLFILEDKLSAEGCSMESAQKKTCFEFGGDMGKLKKLSGLDCHAIILVDGIEYRAKLTHELKLTDGPGDDRVSVYHIKETNLYVAAEYLEHGLHNENAIAKLKKDHQLIDGHPSKMIRLQLPEQTNTMRQS